MAFSRLYAVLCISFLSVTSCWNAFAAQVTSSGTQRVWLTEKPAAYASKLPVTLSTAKEISLPASIDFVGSIDVRDPVDNVDAVLSVKGDDGVIVYTSKVVMSLGRGKNECHFTWTPEGVRDGTYSIRLDIGWQPDHILGFRDVSAQFLTDEAVRSKINEASVAVRALNDHLHAVAADHPESSETRLRVESATSALAAAETTFVDGNWRRAKDTADFLLASVAQTRTELAISRPNTDHAVISPSTDATHARVGEGEFVVDSTPVFLFGGRLNGIGTDQLTTLAKAGFNLAIGQIGPDSTLADEHGETNFQTGLNQFLEAANQNKIAVAVDLAPQRMPDWAYTTWPDLREAGGGSFPYDLTHPNARTLLERHARVVGKALSGKSNVLGAVIADSPEFRITGEATRQGFVALCRAKYGDHEKLNRIWRSRYLDFDEITLDWKNKHPAYQYELQTYQQRLSMDFLDWFASNVHTGAPDLPLLVSSSDSVFDIGESSGGLNRAAIAQRLAVNGCATLGQSVQSFDRDAFDAGMFYTLMRSFNPRAPLFDANCNSVLPIPANNDDAFRHVHAIMWDSIISGLNAWAAPIDGPDGMIQNPGAMQGFGAAGIEANRFARIVEAFQKAPAPLAIVWSDSSKIFKDGNPYLPSVAVAYRGCSTYGYKIRFITEAQCETGELANVQLLVIPAVPSLSNAAFNAINHYAESGGAGVRLGEPIPYDSLGNPRADSLSVSRRSVLVRGANSPTIYLHTMDAANAILKDTDLPHAINEYGFPLERVKTRFVKIDDVPYIFLVNFRNDAVAVTLAGPYCSGEDLISGNYVEFPQQVPAYEPMLIRLDVPNKLSVQTADASPVTTSSQEPPKDGDSKAKTTRKLRR